MKRLHGRIRSAAVAAPFLTCVLAAPVAAKSPQADVVDGDNVAHEPQPRPDSAFWDFELDFGFSGALGNSEYAILTSGFKIEHLHADFYALSWDGSMRYGEGEGDVIARAVKGSVSFALSPEDRWSPFVYTDVERDVFRRLALRTNAGAGIKCNLFVDPNGAASLSATLLHDYKDFDDPDHASELATETHALWTLRAKSTRRLGSGADFDNTTWFKAVHGEPGDYDLDSTTKLSVPVSEHVGLRVTYTIRRDSTPPPDVAKNDQLLQVGLTVGF